MFQPITILMSTKLPILLVIFWSILFLSFSFSISVFLYLFSRVRKRHNVHFLFLHSFLWSGWPHTHWIAHANICSNILKWGSPPSSSSSIPPPNNNHINKRTHTHQEGERETERMSPNHYRLCKREKKTLDYPFITSDSVLCIITS